MKRIYRVDTNKLSKCELILHEYLLENLENIEESSISVISRELCIDPSTINRYSKKIGFTGFKELKYALNKRPPRVQLSQLNEFDELVNQLRPEKLNFIKEEFKKTDSIFFYGESRNSHIIHSVVSQLQLLITDKSIYFSDEPGFATTWLRKHQSSLVFIVSVKGDSENIKWVASIASATNGKIVGITDDRYSFLYNKADVGFIATSRNQISEITKQDFTDKYSTLYILERVIESMVIDDLKQNGHL